ncbi:hypothetical protein ACHAPT_013054 [Fusarium lateritium]
MARTHRGRQRRRSKRPATPPRPIERNKTKILTLKVHPTALAALIDVPDPMCIHVNTRVSQPVPPLVFNNNPTQSQLRPEPTAKTIACESLRKEMAKTHLDFLNDSIQEMQTETMNLTRRPDTAPDDTKTLQTILDFHTQSLGVTLKAAYDSQISTLVRHPNDNASEATIKNRVASLLNSVYIWERELRKSAEKATTEEHALAHISDQLKMLQQQRETLIDSL